MEFREQLNILRSHWILILVLFIVGALAGAGISQATPNMYRASSSLFTSTTSSETTAELQQGSVFAMARVQSYVELATKPAVLQPVIDKLNLDQSVGQLASSINASSTRNSVIIVITATAPSPDQAAEIANSVSSSLISIVATLERPADGKPATIRLSAIDHASPPESPSSPRTKLNIGLGAAAGLGAGVLFAFLRRTLDRRVRGYSDIQRSVNLPILGGILGTGKKSKHGHGPRAFAEPSNLEAFRQIRTNLQFVAVGKSVKSLVVSSATPGEGKTTVAINLARTMAESGRSVILVDADLRRPTVATQLGLEGSVGLTTVLIGSSQLPRSIQHWAAGNVDVLAAGSIPPNPSELLESEAMGAVISQLGGKYDMIIIDSPPVLPVTDATVLTRHTSGFLLVVGSKRVTHHDLVRTMDQLLLVKANVVGMVINWLPRSGPDKDLDYGSSYEPIPDNRAPRMKSRRLYESLLAMSVDSEARRSVG